MTTWWSHGGDACATAATLCVASSALAQRSIMVKSNGCDGEVAGSAGGAWRLHDVYDLDMPLASRLQAEQ